MDRVQRLRSRVLDRGYADFGEHPYFRSVGRVARRAHRAWPRDGSSSAYRSVRTANRTPAVKLRVANGNLPTPTDTRLQTTQAGPGEYGDVKDRLLMQIRDPRRLPWMDEVQLRLMHRRADRAETPHDSSSR